MQYSFDIFSYTLDQTINKMEKTYFFNFRKHFAYIRIRIRIRIRIKSASKFGKK